MSVRYFALILGIIFLLVGVLGFVPGLTTMPQTHEHDLAVGGPGHGYLLGLFHVNLLHNLVHLLFGVWGIIAYRTFDASRVYARSVTIIYAVLAIMGVIPGLNTVFGEGAPTRVVSSSTKRRMPETWKLATRSAPACDGTSR